METRGIFFFNDTATTEIYTLSLHDALPIFLTSRKGYISRSAYRGWAAMPLPPSLRASRQNNLVPSSKRLARLSHRHRDRKSTRLNSSHANISYAVFCLKKKKQVYVIIHISY